jgi:hypothetical protein
MKRLLKALACGAFIATGAVHNAHAVDFNFDPVAPKILFVTGQIELGDDLRLQQVIADRKKHHFGTPLYVMLNSNGGNVHAALAMADIINHENINVGVGSGQTCQSACVLLFAGGKSRLVSGTATISVHQASDVKANDPAAGALQSTTAMAAAFTHYHVPPEVIQMMTSTPGNQVSWITANELAIWPNTTIISPDQ